jgi:hypothetical protein
MRHAAECTPGARAEGERGTAIGTILLVALILLLFLTIPVWRHNEQAGVLPIVVVAALLVVVVILLSTGVLAL